MLSAAPHSTMLTNSITHNIILNMMRAFRISTIVAGMLLVQTPRDLTIVLVILDSAGMVLRIISVR